jgi:hypothetical protein
MGAQPEYLKDIIEIFKKVCSPESIHDYLILREAIIRRNINNEEPRIFLVGNFTKLEEEFEKKLKILFGKKRKIEEEKGAGERMKILFNDFQFFIEPMFTKKVLYSSLTRNYKEEKITIGTFELFNHYFNETYYKPLREKLTTYINNNYPNKAAPAKSDFSKMLGYEKHWDKINDALSSKWAKGRLFESDHVLWKEDNKKHSLMMFIEAIQKYIDHSNLKKGVDPVYAFGLKYFKDKNGKEYKNFYDTRKSEYPEAKLKKFRRELDELIQSLAEL